VLGGALMYAMIHWTLGTVETGKSDQRDLGRDIMTVYRTVSPLKHPVLQADRRQ